MKKYLSSFIVLFLGIITACAQVNVLPAEQSLSTNGIFYSLPQTVIKVNVKVEKELFYAGPLASYADEYLGLENISTSDEATYRITEINIDQEILPDPNQFFFIEFQTDEMKDRHSFQIALDERGLLTGFNKQGPEDGKARKETVVFWGTQKQGKEVLFDYQDITGMRQVVDTVIRQITVDTSVVEEFQISRNWVKKTREEKARQAAERMEKIMQDRYYLSIGYQEVPYEKGTIAYMDKKLEERQKEYEALFTGKKVVSEHAYQFEFIAEKPDKDKEIKETLFRFSPSSGIRDAKSSIGEPVDISIISDQITNQIESKARQLIQTSKNRKGIYYRIPGYGMVALHAEDEVLYAERMRINQLGVVSFAPYSRQMGFSIDPLSGALKRIELDYRD